MAGSVADGWFLQLASGIIRKDHQDPTLRFLLRLVVADCESASVGVGWAVSKCIANYYTVCTSRRGHERNSDLPGGLCSDGERRRNNLLVYLWL